MTNDSTGRIAEELRTWIAGAAPGARLPSSRSLVAEHGASALTVNKAIRSLAREGLVETRPGVGTFVRGVRTARASDLSWQTAALGPRLLRPTPPRALDETHADAAALHAGYPAPDLLPERLVRAALTRAARSAAATMRSPSAGDPELRAWFAAELAELTPAATVPPQPSDVIVVPGSQSGLNAVFRALAGVGGTIVMESPTYWGAINAAGQSGLTIAPVPSGPAGPEVADIERALITSGARAMYLQPDFANPTGAQWTVEKKQQVLALAREHGVFLIEDDWAHDFGIGAEAHPLITGDDTGHVVCIRSLTKSVSPALRVAAVIARGPARERILADVQAESMYTSAILQRAGLDVVTHSGWRSHLRDLRPALAARRDALLDAIRTHLPEAVVEAVPQGGLHLWVRMPDGTDLARLEADCQRDGVLIAGGDAWFPAEPAGPYLRMSFAGPEPHRYAPALAVVAGHLHAQHS